EMARIAFDTSKPVSQSIPLQPSGEVIATLIDSIYTDKPTDVYLTPFYGKQIQTPLYVNVINKGRIPNLPDDVAVEIPVKVDGKGIHPIPNGSIPSRIYKYSMLPRITRVEWALEANLKGGRDTLFQWLIVDVRTKSMKQVEDVIDAILRLPDNEEMAKHFG
ncbi:MAG: alpha-glucosidase/alpha-galactosidase, partial [Candidatus Bathyarchaeia archaeon]